MTYRKTIRIMADFSSETKKAENHEIVSLKC